MRIIKEGKPTMTVVTRYHQGACGACETIVEFVEEEATKLPGDNFYFWVDCPNCKAAKIKGTHYRYETTEVPIEGKS